MLIFHLKKIWFEKIKSGEKTHEYREATPYWDKRILKMILSDCEDEDERGVTEWFTKCSIENKNDFSVPVSIPIIFACGYPSKDVLSRKIYGKAIRISLTKKGLFTDLKIDKPVYDIEFKLIKDVNNDR